MEKKNFPPSRGGGGGGEGETSPPPIIFFANIGSIEKIPDFLSYTYMHPILFKEYKIFDYSSVDNHRKWTKIGKNS